MNYVRIQPSSFINGEGCRVVLWTAGCAHNCKGCQNPGLHDPQVGKFFDIYAMRELIEAIKKPYIDGLTLSGGDPMYPLNRAEATNIAQTVKQMTGKSIWMYTGYLLSEIEHEPIMDYLDVVVDGRFEEKLKDDDYMWAGSTNQIIWVKADGQWRMKGE